MLDGWRWKGKFEGETYTLYRLAVPQSPGRAKPDQGTKTKLPALLESAFDVSDQLAS